MVKSFEQRTRSKMQADQTQIRSKRNECNLRDMARNLVPQKELEVEPLLLHTERFRWLPGRLHGEEFRSCPTERKSGCPCWGCCCPWNPTYNAAEEEEEHFYRGQEHCKVNVYERHSSRHQVSSMRLGSSGPATPGQVCHHRPNADQDQQCGSSGLCSHPLTMLRCLRWNVSFLCNMICAGLEPNWWLVLEELLKKKIFTGVTLGKFAIIEPWMVFYTDDTLMSPQQQPPKLVCYSK